MGVGARGEILPTCMEAGLPLQAAGPAARWETQFSAPCFRPACLAPQQHALHRASCSRGAVLGLPSSTPPCPSPPPEGPLSPWAPLSCAGPGVLGFRGSIPKIPAPCGGARSRSQPGSFVSLSARAALLGPAQPGRAPLLGEEKKRGRTGGVPGVPPLSPLSPQAGFVRAGRDWPCRQGQPLPGCLA